MTAPPGPPAPRAQLPTGFAAPGPDTQAVFRCALQALSRPGRCFTLPGAACRSLAPPARISVALAALLLTLLDGETRIWLAPSLDQPLLRSWLAFHTGTALAPHAAAARFVAAQAHDLTPLLWAGLERGSAEAPQDGSTVLLDVPLLAEGPGLLLRGPGIADTQRLQVRGVDPEIWREREADQRLYPQGVDLLLCCGQRVAGLPRSTRLSCET